MNDTPYVLDSSALMALIRFEPGWEMVDQIVSSDDTNIYMCAINYAEVLSKSIKVPFAIITGATAFVLTTGMFGFMTSERMTLPSKVVPL